MAGVVRAREGQKIRTLVVLGERGNGTEFLGILGQGRVTTGWVDDPVQIQDGIIQRRRQDIGRQEGRAGRVNKCA